eukprot:11599216-Prorocentrum_lima.AAC.1
MCIRDRLPRGHGADRPAGLRQVDHLEGAAGSSDQERQRDSRGRAREERRAAARDGRDVQPGGIPSHAARHCRLP